MVRRIIALRTGGMAIKMVVAIPVSAIEIAENAMASGTSAEGGIGGGERLIACK